MRSVVYNFVRFFFFQAEDGIRDRTVTGVQTCALPICDGAVAGPFKNEIDLTELVLDPHYRVVIDALVAGAQLPEDLALQAVRAGPRVDVDLEAAESQQDRAEDPNRSGAQHDGSLRLPEHSLLDLPGLKRGLLYDAERLEEHGEPPQGRRAFDHALGLFAVVVAHVAMRTLDAALGVVAEEAHVALSGLAIWAIVRAAHGRHDEVPGREALHPLPHRLDDAERFVADDEHVRTGGRFTVLAVVDLGVRAVDANLEDPHERPAALQLRFGKLNLLRAAGFLRCDRDRAPGVS